MANPDDAQRSGTSLGRMMVYTLLFCILALFLFKYFGSIRNAVGSYTVIPKEMQVNYVPADFDFTVDEEDALAILSNPHRYRAEFNDLIYRFNLSLIHHVANRMDMADSLKMMINSEYDKHHPYIKQLYYNDFIAIRDTASNLYEAWYNKEGASAVEALNEVASKYTCFFVNHVITTLLKTTDGKYMAKGRKIDTPCGIALTEALNPLVKRLQDKAAIQDFGRSKGLLEEKVEKVIAELATMEVRDKKGINKQLQTKIWGINVSSTDLEVTAISILKVGFKLDKYFDINLNNKRKLVTITLPEPEILSHEVFPKVDKLDIGWMREVDTEDFNRNFNILRREFRREAIESNIMDKAKGQAKDLMTMMMGPLVSSIGKNYKIAINFKSFEPVYDDKNTEVIGASENKQKKKTDQSEYIPFD